MTSSRVAVVGVDVGGTKTHIRVRRPDGAFEDSVSPTAQWRPVEQERDPGALLELLAASADLRADTVVGIGAHGCDTRAQCREFAADLSAHSPATFLVVNDAELLVPAAGLTRGVGLVVGTGSIVVGQNAADELISTGGWGWILGDPCSGPALVRESAKAALAAADAGEPPDPLARALCAAYGVDSPLQLAYTLTAARSITDWASRAPVVFAAAHEGSQLARVVLERQATELVHQVGALLDRGAQGRDIVLGGGVIAAQPGFASTLAAQLAQRFDLSVTILHDDPVAGALALAERHHPSVSPGHQRPRSPYPSAIPGAGSAD